MFAKLLSYVNRLPAQAKVAKDELDLSRLELLKVQTNREYYECMEQVIIKRIARLELICGPQAKLELDHD